jgi:uncharacterized protein YggE
MSKNMMKLKLIGAALCMVISSGLARADEGITVSASGEVKAKPTVVEIGATVSADAELTADAIVKYREAKKKGVDAITNLKMPNVTMESNGYTVNAAVDQQQQMRMMQGMGGGTATKQKVEVSEQMKLTIKDADKLEPEKLMDTLLKVIDTGKDAGLVIGPPPATNYYEMQIRAASGKGASMVLFKLGDINALKEQAYKIAMDSASAKAKRLAELAGVKLGRVVSVQEGQPKDDNSNSGQNASRAMAMMNMGIPFVPNEQTDVSSNLCGDIPVKVVLSVQYEIVK